MTRLAADRDRVEPGPTPVPRGAPPAELLCPAGTPPTGMEFRLSVATVHCWMVACPSCCVGWCALVPDGSRYGYPDVRQIAYARGVVRNSLAATLDGKDPYAAARRSGAYIKPAGFKSDVLVAAFVAASVGKADEHKLLNAILAGAATLGRLPR